MHGKDVNTLEALTIIASKSSKICVICITEIKGSSGTIEIETYKKIQRCRKL
jgi:hypothetical protein